MWCPGNNLGVMSEPISELISEMISETMSELMSASMSESMSGMISETMSELMSESMSESMSEMMSEMMHDDFAQSARFPLCAYHEGILLNPRDACAYSAKFPHGAENYRLQILTTGVPSIRSSALNFFAGAASGVP